MVFTSRDLKAVITEVRPVVERQLDDALTIASFRETVTAKGGDWSQVKALVKAMIQDERDDAGGHKRVLAILSKAGNAIGYADMLGLTKLNEKNSFEPEHDADGVIIEPGHVPVDGGAFAAVMGANARLANAVGVEPSPSNPSTTKGGQHGHSGERVRPADDEQRDAPRVSRSNGRRESSDEGDQGQGFGTAADDRHSGAVARTGAGEDQDGRGRHVGGEARHEVTEPEAAMLPQTGAVETLVANKGIDTIDTLPSAKAARLCSSLGRAATLHHEEYRSTDTALGRRLGMCRSTRALCTTGRFGGLGCHRRGVICAVGGYVSSHLTGAFNSSGPFFHFRRQRAFQGFRQRFPDHSRKSFREPVASTATKPREAMNAVPNFQASGSSHDR